MKKIVLFAFACFFSQAALQAEEAYSGVAQGTGGAVGARSMQFDFRIKEYTSDARLQELADMLREEGADKLRRTLEKENVGRINPVGRVGNDIAIARKRKVGDKTVITIVTPRIMSFTELYASGRSTDYPFGFMQVTLDASGKGEGKIMAAAKIRFNKKNRNYEIESFGNQYIRAVNVRPWK